MKKILVLALGNPLMSDDGLGFAAMERLQSRRHWPENVTFLDGHVLGLSLLPYIENYDRLLVIDSVRTGEAPGTLVRLEDDEIPAVVKQKMSVHQVGFQEALAMGKIMDSLPEHIVLWGIVPEHIYLGMDLSKTTANQLPALCNAINEELTSWLRELATVPSKVE